MEFLTRMEQRIRDVVSECGKCGEYDEYAAKKLQKHDERQKKYNAMRRDKQVAE